MSKLHNWYRRAWCDYGRRFNGDGVDDIVILVEKAALEGKEYAGRTYVLFGNRDWGTSMPANLKPLELKNLLPENGGDGSRGFVVNGIHANDRLGSCASTAGNLNGDGICDLVIGANQADPHGLGDAGQTFVIFGMKTNPSDNGVSHNPFPAIFDLAKLDGLHGFAVNGAKANDRAGLSVSSGSDLNGDGVSDLVIAAPMADPGDRPEAGQIFVVYGRQAVQPSMSPIFVLSSLLAGPVTTGFLINGSTAHDRTGTSLNSDGDFNGDRLNDLAIGAHWNTELDQQPQEHVEYRFFA